MKYKKYGRYSLIGWLNRLICQWLLFRLQAVVSLDDDLILGYEVIFPILPLTGWKSGYIPQRYLTIPVWVK